MSENGKKINGLLNIRCKLEIIVIFGKIKDGYLSIKDILNYIDTVDIPDSKIYDVFKTINMYDVSAILEDVQNNTDILLDICKDNSTEEI